MVGPPFRPDQFVKPARGNLKMSKSVFATSGGGHTLRCHDLGMILAWHRNGASDGEHSADVMNKDGWCRAAIPG